MKVYLKLPKLNHCNNNLIQINCLLNKKYQKNHNTVNNTNFKKVNITLIIIKYITFQKLINYKIGYQESERQYNF